ncbi:hypothetical protein CfE428DRAFT_1424 [Chthoniobacter flavus Ellin428]|uniref:Uncharacterized protein n=1 Tax=Chthoniobacter flavus Ellin428 TaxID=497964 RepID=B4CXY3_9BACT|nr:hypothetical protein [Chthoniobacter flavus]EDY21131.1 hypothetical protein CfE428DRAFT_1424 [Chthoniobacter flavus Ellin428]TCO87505.1 hypothetical protein EV701_1217 [Chthoniobacter flavus]
MPNGRYFLADGVLTALFTLSDRDCRNLLAAFDQIAENPCGLAAAAGQDWDGRSVYLAAYGNFEIGYFLTPDSGTVTVTLLRILKT